MEEKGKATLVSCFQFCLLVREGVSVNKLRLRQMKVKEGYYDGCIEEYTLRQKMEETITGRVLEEIGERGLVSDVSRKRWSRRGMDSKKSNKGVDV